MRYNHHIFCLHIILMTKPFGILGRDFINKLLPRPVRRKNGIFMAEPFGLKGY